MELTGIIFCILLIAQQNFLICNGQLLALNITLIPPVPEHSVITYVRFKEPNQNRSHSYNIESIRSRLTDATHKSLPAYTASCPSYFDTVKMSLYIDNSTGYLKTSPFFKAIPGEILTVIVSGLDSQRTRHFATLTINILCSYNVSQRYISAFENDSSCIRMSKSFMLANPKLSATYMFQFPQSSSFNDVFYIEVFKAKIPYIFNVARSIILFFNVTCDSSTSKETRYQNAALKRLTLSAYKQDRSVRIPIPGTLIKPQCRLDVAILPLKYIDYSKSNATYREISPMGEAVLSFASYHEDALQITWLSNVSGPCGNRNCLAQFSQPSINIDAYRSCPLDADRACLDVETWYNNCKANLTLNLRTMSPTLVRLSSSASVMFQCSYSAIFQDQSKFHWSKDGHVIKPAKGIELLNAVEGQNVLNLLGFSVERVEQQGYYSFHLKTKYAHQVSSRKALVLIEDISFIKFIFTGESILSKSKEDALLPEKLTEKTKSWLSTIGIDPNKTTSSGTSFKYSTSKSGAEFAVTIFSLNTTQRLKVCGNLKHMYELLSTSSKLEIKSFDCCQSVTHEENIQWPITLVNHTAVAPCPYRDLDDSKVSMATRKCIWNSFNGALWLQPDMKSCPKKISNLSELANKTFTARNVLEASKMLLNLSKGHFNKSDIFILEKKVAVIKKITDLETVQPKVASNVLTVASGVLDANQKVLAKGQRDLGLCKKLLVSIQQIANKLNFTGTNTTIETNNIALAVTKVDGDSNASILVRAWNDQQISKIEVLSVTELLEQGAYQTSLFLPAATIYKATSISNTSDLRFTSVQYSNAKLFTTVHGNSGSRNFDTRTQPKKARVDSKIISGSIVGVRLRNLAFAEEIKLGFRQLSSSKSRSLDNQCVYWDFNANDGNGGWSSKGCRAYGYSDSIYSCRCNHMTHFGVLIQVDQSADPLSARQRTSLSIVTYVGCIISFMCLLLTLATFGCFENLRRKQPLQIHMFLCFSLLLTITTFLAGLHLKDRTSCKVFSALLHFFVLSSFCWMAVEGISLYLYLVKVMRSATLSQLVRNSNLFCWGLPAIIVGMTAGVTKTNAYVKKNADGSLICIITEMPFYIAYLLPIIVIMLMNLVILALVSRSLMRDPALSKTNRMTKVTKVRITFGCSLVMGTTWIVGLFAVGVFTFTFQLIFCLLNSLQGLFIFIFYCAMSKDVRKEWAKFLNVEQKSTSSNTPGVIMKPSNSRSKKAKDDMVNMNTGSNDVKERKVAKKSDEIETKGVLFNFKECKVDMPGDETVVLLEFRPTSSIKIH